MRGTWIKNSVLLLGITFGGMALLAQQSTAPEAQPAPETTTQSTAAPTGKMPLSAEQKQQLSSLRMAMRDQAAIIRHDQTLSAEQKAAKLKALRASTREQMKSVLTPEQQQAFAQRREARKDAFAAKLGLTADQQTKLKTLFQSTRQQRQAVLNNASLTNDQKQAQLSQIRQGTHAQLATILTPEQLQQFQQMRKAHHHEKQG
jgi:Spy/CpxP family protein refolding chaperone